MEETVSDTVLVALITAADTIISAGLAAVLQKTNKRWRRRSACAARATMAANKRGKSNSSFNEKDRHAWNK
jgi:hypothetical protein